MDGKCDMLLEGIKALFPVGILIAYRSLLLFDRSLLLFDRSLLLLIGLLLGRMLSEGVKALFFFSF
jgi:hypothetical protein